MTETKSQQKNWQKKRLADIAEVTSSKRIYQSDYVSSGVPFYRSKEIIEKGENKSISTELFITKEKFTDIKKKFGVPETGDLLITSVGTLGKLYQVKPDDLFYFKDGNLIWLRNFSGLADSNYIFYLIKSENVQQKLKSIAIGSSQSAFTISSVKEVEVSLPEKTTQKQIVDVLSTYDELIENNTRRIEILEELAQSIYKEWFVHYRFPGHEKVKMIDSRTEFGMIPEGWGIGLVSDVTYLLSGFSFKSKSFTENGTHKVITIKSVQDGSFVPENSDAINEIPTNLPSHCRLEDGDILLSLTGNVGRVCLAYGENQLLNQRVAKLQTNDEMWSFVYSLFRNIDFKNRIINIANGSAQQNLSPIQTSKLPIVIPSSCILKQYASTTNEMLEEMMSLNKQNAYLCQARDLLLPKLVNGKLDLK